MRTTVLRTAAILLLTLFAGVPFTAHAQRGIGINAGLAVPFGDLGDISGTGYSVGVDGFFKFVDRFPNLRFGGRIGYNGFSENNYEGVGEDISSSASTIEVVPALRYLFLADEPEQKVGYFAQLGPGLYVTTLDFENFVNAEDDTEVDFGVQVGAGVTYRLLDTVTAVAMPIFNFTDNSYMTFSVGFIFGRRTEVPAGTSFQ